MPCRSFSPPAMNIWPGQRTWPARTSRGSYEPQSAPLRRPDPTLRQKSERDRHSRLPTAATSLRCGAKNICTYLSPHAVNRPVCQATQQICPTHASSLGSIALVSILHKSISNYPGCLDEENPPMRIRGKKLRGISLSLFCLWTILLFTGCSLFGGSTPKPGKAPASQQVYISPLIFLNGNTDLTTLDPALAYDQNSLTAISLIFTGLVSLD